MTFELSESLTETDKKAFKEAKEMVSRLEQAHNGDINKVISKIDEEQRKIDLFDNPSPQNLYQQRVTELASRYVHISDGKMGVDTGSHKNAINAMKKALQGINGSGGLLHSQSAAIACGQVNHVSTHNLSRMRRGPTIEGKYSP